MNAVIYILVSGVIAYVASRQSDPGLHECLMMVALGLAIGGGVKLAGTTWQTPKISSPLGKKSKPGADLAWEQEAARQSAPQDRSEGESYRRLGEDGWPFAHKEPEPTPSTNPWEGLL